MLGTAAEIGVAEGNFSHDLLQAGIPHLYMVDNWATIKNVKGDGNFAQHWHDKNFKRAKEQVQEFTDRYKILKGMSTHMATYVADESLSMVYLDADHSYEGALNDLTAWYPKVKPGGIIAGHDYLNPSYGIREAVSTFTNITPIVIPENNSADASYYFIKP